MATPVADRLTRKAARLRSLPEELVARATNDVYAAVYASLKADAGPDRRLSGVRNGRPQTVKRVNRTGLLVEGRVMAGPPKQRAPWFWLEEGTKAGRRGGRSGSKRSYRGYHPGTKAKQTWSRPINAVTPRVRRMMLEEMRAAIKG